MDGECKDDRKLIASNSKSVTFDKNAGQISTGLDEDDEENATTLSINTVREYIICLRRTRHLVTNYANIAVISE